MYKTRDELYPRFGFALPDSQLAHVREDLPECVKLFVISHELYPLNDKAQWWARREIKANANSAVRHLIGFVACVLMSLAPYRLRYYRERVRG